MPRLAVPGSVIVWLALAAGCLARDGYGDCDTSGDCPDGWRCLQGSCVKPCAQDADCVSGRCSAGTCWCDSQPCRATCQADLDCAQLEQCVDAVCIAVGRCGGAPANACGGCAVLAHEPGEPCAACGLYRCNGVDALICDDSGSNACGGCAALSQNPGDPCGSLCGGRIVCDGPDAVACGEAADVLQNSHFEVSPVCSAGVVSGWTISESAAWISHSGRPLVSDDTACGVGAFWGCDMSLGSHSDGTCLAVWGQDNVGVGEWIEVSQTYVPAGSPSAITGLAISYVRWTGQWSFGWQYEVFYEIDGTRTWVDGASNTNVAASPFSSGVLLPVATDAQVTVILRVEKIAVAGGHGWLSLDDFVVDVCWQ